ncbi:MAG: hypothetical protein HY735_08375 [Verrucomicrobia bacterium]|nr:hypothetical protein [Verrucomicrobiota bacterium]
MKALRPNLEHSHEKSFGRKTRVWIAAFVGVISALSCLVVLVHQPTWPAAIVVSAEVAVVITFCHLVLREDYRGDRGMDYTRKVCSPAFRRPEPAKAGTTNADLSFIQRSRQ